MIQEKIKIKMGIMIILIMIQNLIIKRVILLFIIRKTKSLVKRKIIKIKIIQMINVSINIYIIIWIYLNIINQI